MTTALYRSIGYSTLKYCLYEDPDRHNNVHRSSEQSHNVKKPARFGTCNNLADLCEQRLDTAAQERLLLQARDAFDAESSPGTFTSGFV